MRAPLTPCLKAREIERLEKQGIVLRLQMFLMSSVHHALGDTKFEAFTQILVLWFLHPGVNLRVFVAEHCHILSQCSAV